MLKQTVLVAEQGYSKSTVTCSKAEADRQLIPQENCCPLRFTIDIRQDLPTGNLLWIVRMIKKQ